MLTNLKETSYCVILLLKDGEDIFNAIQDYFCENEIDWAKFCGVYTDGGKSMSGCYKGLRGRIKIVAPHVTRSHCCIHRQSLVAKPLPDSLKEVLNQSVKVVNFIKANSTNTRLFKSLCGDMGSLHTMLLLHREVRWLSRGNVLTRLFALRHEVLMFFEDHPFTLSSKFYESEWLQQLAYLSDIFSEINKLNLGLQNHPITIFKVTDKIESMIKKLNFWKSCIKKTSMTFLRHFTAFYLRTNLN
ncbi:Zinc finger BED domain-containing protein 5 [Araneus ventricosus]|uniref:Zinc finger BED domain-containing protein 5 n=1 Tax=Araneus ventricosus TaxID=182803 RepID=A0A4Y2JY58_ARAVE|nr:Zinc finger BED domain-containing protein 5 [Araneus ventricosus]